MLSLLSHLLTKLIKLTIGIIKHYYISNSCNAVFLTLPLILLLTFVWAVFLMCCVLFNMQKPASKDAQPINIDSKS